MENRVIIIAGPTCVGKTGVSVLLARELGTEIISADSMQIFRGMDIGTEKPSPAELSAVRHHMIDIAEPSEHFSAGRYVEMVRPVIEKLLSEGRIPVVTGGTGLYIRALTEGMFEGPDADWDLRDSLMEEPVEALYKRLGQMDPEAASSISPGDLRRIVRALEVCIRSGRKVSELRDEATAPLPYDYIKVGLFRDRSELYPMIEERVDRMIGRGLLEEVRGLLEAGMDRTAMQAIGYKEIAGHLRGEYPLEEAVALIKRNTRRYAKRQYTWFRREQGLRWVDVTGSGSAGETYGKVRAALLPEGLFQSSDVPGS